MKAAFGAQPLTWLVVGRGIELQLCELWSSSAVKGGGPVEIKHFVPLIPRVDDAVRECVSV